MRKSFVAFGILLACGAAQAAGTVAIDGGAPNQLSRFWGDIKLQQYIATTELVLSTSASFNQFDWWGGYGVGTGAQPDDSFQLIIYSGANNLPTAPIYAETLGTGNAVATGKAFPSGTLEYAYSGSFSTITLPAGEYFFGMQRNGGYGVNDWGWEQTNGGQQLGGGTFDQFNNWTPSSTENLAFQALGTTAPVPEPSGYALMAAGLGTLLFVARRRRPA